MRFAAYRKAQNGGFSAALIHPAGIYLQREPPARAERFEATLNSVVFRGDYCDVTGDDYAADLLCLSPRPSSRRRPATSLRFSSQRKRSSFCETPNESAPCRGRRLPTIIAA